MASRGDESSNPGGEQRLSIVLAAADTGGTLLEMEACYGPGSVAPPSHAHPRQEERFTVLVGTLRVRIGGREHQIGPGDRLVIPPGTPHTMWPGGDKGVRFRWEVRPALRTESFFAHLYGLAGRSERLPLLPLAALFRAYRDEFRLTSAPYRLLFGVLGALARRRGSDFR